jgi:hypothetical protein
MTRRNLVIANLMIVVMAAGGAIWLAQSADVAKDQQQVSPASGKAKKLLLMMDRDSNGKISKHEWMKFMEAEFDRLDQDRTGELDPNELQQSNLSLTHLALPSFGKFPSFGK